MMYNFLRIISYQPFESSVIEKFDNISRITVTGKIAFMKK